MSIQIGSLKKMNAIISFLLLSTSRLATCAPTLPLTKNSITADVGSQVPSEIISKVSSMGRMSFETLYDFYLSVQVQGQPRNPLDRTVMNPFVDHDERSEKVGKKGLLLQNVFKLSNDAKRMFYLKQLLRNPTVYCHPWEEEFLNMAAMFGDEEFFDLLASRDIVPNKKCLDLAFKSQNSVAVRYMLRDRNLMPDSESLSEILYFQELGI